MDGTAHTVHKNVTVLGRDPQADIPILHSEVSRKHAVVIAQGAGRYLLMDFKSSNGTKLNGHTIESAELKDGDKINLGGRTLSVEGLRPRRGSLASTGEYKLLLEMENAPSVPQELQSYAQFWAARLEEVAPHLEALRSLRASTSLSDLSRKVLQLSIECVEADRGLLLLLEPDGEAFAVRAQVGYPEGLGLRKNLHQSLLDEALDNDRIVSTGPKFFRKVFAAMEGTPTYAPLDVGSAVAAPLGFGGKPGGAIFLDRKRDKGDFGPKDRAILRHLSQLCAPHLIGQLLESLHLELRHEVEILQVQLHAGEHGNCEVCGNLLEDQAVPLVECFDCKTRYHEDCWEFLGKCAIFACTGAMANRLHAPGFQAGLKKEFPDR